MELVLKLKLPPPGITEKPEPEKSLEETVREMIEKVDSYEDSAVEWKALKRFYSDLCKCGDNPRAQSLRKMIRPVLAKYGFFVE